jgi:protein-S-isoprenylcysteine O-methyltransferase Ste14
VTTFASVVGFAVMVGALVGLFLRHGVLSPSAPVVVLQVLAVALMVWARRTFGRRSFHATASPTAGGLVTTGPYRWVRHPIYTAVCLFGWACWLGHPSWFSAGMAGLVTAGGVARMLAEERRVVVRYPEYAEYARRTKRAIPYLL